MLFGGENTGKLMLKVGDSEVGRGRHRPALSARASHRAAAARRSRRGRG
jgi:hypothetical protein